MPYESSAFLPKVYNFLNSFFIPVDKTIPKNPSHANIPFSTLKLLVHKYFAVSWCVSDVSNMKAQSSLNSHSLFKHSVWWCISTTILQRVSLLVWWSFWSLPLTNRVHTWAFLVNGSHSPWWNCHPRSPTSDLHYRLSHFFSFPIPLLSPLFHLLFLFLPLQVFIIDYLTSSVFPFPFCLLYSISSSSYLFHFRSSLQIISLLRFSLSPSVSSIPSPSIFLSSALQIFL